MLKSTTDLLNELSDSKCDIHKYITENKGTMIKNDINEFWERVIAESGMSKSNIINKSDFSYRYFYDVINGRKIPSRDKIVRLMMTMKSGVEFCQEALRLSDKCALYPKIQRDSIIIFALQNEFALDELQELLTQYDEETIS